MPGLTLLESETPTCSGTNLNMVVTLTDLNLSVDEALSTQGFASLSLKYSLFSREQ